MIKNLIAATFALGSIGLTLFLLFTAQVLSIWVLGAIVLSGFFLAFLSYSYDEWKWAFKAKFCKPKWHWHDHGNRAVAFFVSKAITNAFIFCSTGFLLSFSFFLFFTLPTSSFFLVFGFFLSALAGIVFIYALMKAEEKHIWRIATLLSLLAAAYTVFILTQGLLFTPIYGVAILLSSGLGTIIIVLLCLFTKGFTDTIGLVPDERKGMKIFAVTLQRSIGITFIGLLMGYGFWHVVMMQTFSLSLLSFSYLSLIVSGLGLFGVILSFQAENNYLYYTSWGLLGLSGLSSTVFLCFLLNAKIYGLISILLVFSIIYPLCLFFMKCYLRGFESVFDMKKTLVNYCETMISGDKKPGSALQKEKKQFCDKHGETNTKKMTYEEKLKARKKDFQDDNTLFGESYNSNYTYHCREVEKDRPPNTHEYEMRAILDPERALSFRPCNNCVEEKEEPATARFEGLGLIALCEGNPTA